MNSKLDKPHINKPKKTLKRCRRCFDLAQLETITEQQKCNEMNKDIPRSRSYSDEQLNKRSKVVLCHSNSFEDNQIKNSDSIQKKLPKETFFYQCLPVSPEVNISINKDLQQRKDSDHSDLVFLWKRSLSSV